MTGEETKMICSKEHHATRMTGAERRRQLLDAAASVFGKKGFAGTTTKEIANLAQVNEALIFKHFESKEQLFETVLLEQRYDEVKKGYLAQLEQAIRDKNDEKVFETFGKIILHKHRSNRDVYRMLIFCILENRRPVLELMRKQMDPLISKMTDYINGRIKDSELRCPDPELYIVGLIGMVGQQGMMGELFPESGLLPDDKVALRTFTKIILDSMAQRADDLFEENNKDATQ